MSVVPAPAELALPTAEADLSTRIDPAGPIRFEVAELEEIARRIRVAAVRTIHATRVGHLGGSLSEADILAALYFRTLRVRPSEPGWPDRDRFVLSKGHAAVGLYATLALRGYFPVSELPTFDQLGTRLQGHPDMRLAPGVDMSSGSLGLGISAAVGMSLAARVSGRPYRTFALLGDGECQEGSVWEAAMVGARYGLDSLVAIVDHNRLQQYGWQGAGPEDRLPPQQPGELAAKWAAFGWRVVELDGHDMAALVAALDEAVDRPDGRPVALIARTVKGRGLSFAEGRYLWHVKVPSDDELALAMRELGEPGEPHEPGEPGEAGVPPEPRGARKEAGR
jgi:transketolase